MNKYKLLIIDDELDTRQAGYEIMFQSGGDYDLSFCNPADIVRKIHDVPAHGYVLDFRLGNPEFFKTAMQEISKRNRPVMVLSSKWSDPETRNLLFQLHPDQRAQIRYFIAWDEHWKDGELIKPMASSTCDNIKLALDQHYIRSAITPPENQTVSILHIADLQFGDPETASDSFLDENELADNVRGHSVSFVAVTGDVTYSGHPDEYRQAKEWLDRLSKRLWPGKIMPEHLLIVPGNHDVDLRCCAAGGYDYQFPDPKTPGDKWKLVDRRSILTPYPGLGQFKEFLFRLTDDTNWLRPDAALFRCQDQFLGFGIRFIHLASSMSATADAPGHCHLNEEFLRELADDVEQKNKIENASSIFTVVLSHHGFPSHELRRDYNGFENGDVVTRFLDRVQADMLLLGHGHGMVARQRPDEPLCGLIEVMAPTLRLGQRKRQEDELRGFNIIKFERSGGQVTRINLIPYEIRAGKILERPVDGRWSWKPRKTFFSCLHAR